MCMCLSAKVKGQGHRVKKVQKVAMRQPCGAVSLRCDATQRDGAARLSRRLIEGDRVAGVSYALY